MKPLRLTSLRNLLCPASRCRYNRSMPPVACCSLEPEGACGRRGQTVLRSLSMSSEVRASDGIPTSHPRGFYFIFWGEFAERCSYYGMRAILFLYLTQALTFPDTEAGPIYMAFKMSCYFLPLLGGFLADRYFGKYWTIVGFSVPYVLGHFVLGISSHIALVIALALLAGGSGVIKPNISTLMGLTYDQLRPGQSALRTAAFQWFYFSINVGALLSTFGLPAIRDHLAHSYLVARYEYEEEKTADGKG